MRLANAIMLGGALLLGACAHTEVREHGAVDTEHKTISVPPYKRGLMHGVVKELAAAGWKITVDSSLAAPDPKGRKPPARGADRESRASMTSSGRAGSATRYRLTANARSIDYCRGGRIYIFDFAIIDNQSGVAVLEIGGRECDRDIIAKFRAAIAGKGK